MNRSFESGCVQLEVVTNFYADPPARVAVTGGGIGYVHGDKMLTLFHCPTCGVITHWNPVDPNYNRMGINLRLFDPKLWEALPRKFVDGASW
jgi:hypothetical protein